jgi:hypothetical protein
MEGVLHFLYNFFIFDYYVCLICQHECTKWATWTLGVATRGYVCAPRWFHTPTLTCLRCNSRAFYIGRLEKFISEMKIHHAWCDRVLHCYAQEISNNYLIFFSHYIPCLARRAIQEKLNVGINEETIVVAD